MVIKNLFEKILKYFTSILGKSGPGERFFINIGIAEWELINKKIFFYNNNVRQKHNYNTGWVKSNRLITIDPVKEPNPHIVILGMSGFGKSTLLKSILIDINNMKRPAIIFDTHNEHEDIVLSLSGKVYNAFYNGVNLFELNGASVAERISEITMFFKSIYSLGYIQATKLSECLWYTYRKNGASGKGDRFIKNLPTIKDVISEINIFISNSSSSMERNTLMHLKEKLSILNTAAFNSNYIQINDLRNGISSFSLASLGSSETQLIYIHELLRMLYKNMKTNAKERGLSIYFILDEAQFLIENTRNSYGIIKKMVEEGRKYGVGVIIATHITRNIGRQIIANASTLVSFYSREPGEVNYIANAMSGSDPAKDYLIKRMLSNLRQNEAIIISSSIRNPVVVKTARINEIKNFINISKSENEIDGGTLMDITSKVTDYRDIMEMAPEENLQKLIDDKVIDRFVTNEGNNERIWIMKHKQSLSIEHEAHVRIISEKLSELNIRNYINRHSGPDIVAYRNGGKIAIEYETGRKSKSNTGAMLGSRSIKFDKVIVFVNSGAVKFYQDYFENDKVKIIDIKELNALKESDI